jgi:hypothetical protein
VAVDGWMGGVVPGHREGGSSVCGMPIMKTRRKKERAT